VSKLEIRTNGIPYQSIEFDGNVTMFVSTKAGGGQFVVEGGSLAYVDLRNIREVGPVVADPDWASGAVIMSANFRIDPNTPRTVDVNFDVQGGAEADERSIDFGDGTIVTDQSNQEHTYEADGDYTLTVGFAGLTATQDISFPIPEGVPVDSWFPFGYPWPGGEDPVPDPEAEPTNKNTKAEILSWLGRKGVHIGLDAEHKFTKEELLEIVKNFLDNDEDPIASVLKAHAAKEAKEAKEAEKKEPEKAPLKK